MSNIVSDKYRNRIKVSDRDISVNLAPNPNEKKSNISNRPGNEDSFIGISTGSKIGERKVDNSEIGKSNIGKITGNGSVTINPEVKKLVLHNCVRGAGSCKEMTDRSLWFYIGTYKSKVTYCPYCGYKTRSN